MLVIFRLHGKQQTPIGSCHTYHCTINVLCCAVSEIFEVFNFLHYHSNVLLLFFNLQIKYTAWMPSNCMMKHDRISGKAEDSTEPLLLVYI